MSKDASFVTERNRSRMLFAARVMQEASFINSQQGNINLEGPLVHPMSYNPHYYKMKEGAYFTTVEEYNSYVQSVTPSSSSSSATVPDAPVSLSVTSGNTELIISFTEPDDGGSPITNYEYYPVDASGADWTAFSPAVTSSPVTITGLPNGSALRFKLRAVNAIGPGAESHIVTGTPQLVDEIVNSLTTSLADYTAASDDDWVKITSIEWTTLQTNISGTSKAGATDTVLSGAVGAGLANSNAALVANSVTSTSPSIAANHYLYGFAMKWGALQTTAGIRVYTNTSTTNFSGFNQVGSALPDTSTAGIVYYVRKGVSNTNGSTAGILSFFTGTKMDYPNPSFTGSAGDIAFNNSVTPKPGMLYLLNSGTVPASPTTISGRLDNYGAFAIQGLTTATKQWA
jgi:hypothetical protein